MNPASLFSPESNIELEPVSTKKNLAALLLCVAIAFPQYAFAALFCATTPEGTVRLDECKYASYDECKRAAGTDCVADTAEVPPAVEMGPYCIVTWGVECTYHDYETCRKTAEKKVGFCYPNPDYKAPDKQ